MTTTPATEPTPTGPTAAQAGTTPHTLPPLTRTQKWIVGGVATGATAIAGIGFYGSYSAVSDLATKKGMGDFAHLFPIGVDVGIGIFLALDLLLTWLRMPFPLLRYGAWFLTGATIAFNAATAWPDCIGVGLHAVTPILFVLAVEGARHAIGRGADIVADKHIEYPPFSRWFTHPIDQAIIVRRQRGWGIRDYREVIQHRKEVRIYKARLRKDHGRGWGRKAPADKLLVLQLARYGMSIADAIDLPAAEARKAAEAQHRAELAEAEAEAKRRAEVAEAEAAEAEARHRAEAAKAEAEAKQRIEAARAAEVEAEVKRKSEAEAARLLREASEAEAAGKLRLEAAQREEARKARLAEAEAEATLSALAIQQRQAKEEADAKSRERQRLEQQRIDDEQRRDDARKAEEARLLKERQKAEKTRTEVNRLREQAAATSASTSTSAPGPTSDLARKTTSVSAASSAPKPTVSVSVSETANLGGRRSKRQAEVDEVLARIVESGDPKSVSLEWVMSHFDLKQTTAYDRLVTAQKLWAEANAA